MINGGEVSVTGFFWRSANANKNGISTANRFTGVGGVRNVPCLSSRRKNLLKVLFVNGHTACLEPGNALFINIRTNDIVTRFRETGPSNQPYVSTSDDRKTQKRTSLSWSSNSKNLCAWTLVCIVTEGRERKKVFVTFSCLNNSYRLGTSSVF